MTTAHGATASAGPDAGASAEAIQYHYDVGDAFYGLFQDRTLTYSCAMLEEGDDLEAAQQRKHDWHIVQAGASGAARVLDVGCGWGASLRRMVSTHGVSTATGLTLSRAQQDHITALSEPGIEVRLEGWSAHDPAVPYDAIISIGAFEHFARFRIPPAEKLAAYRRYFERCRALLRPGARMTLQTIAYGDIPRDRVFADEFIASQIFPESDLPRLADIAEASEGTFEILSVRNDRNDYAWTCRQWFNRLRANRSAAMAMVGEEIVLRYERYLRTFSHSFALGAFQLLRMVFARIDHPRDGRGRTPAAAREGGTP